MNLPTNASGGDGPQVNQNPSAVKGMLTLLLVSIGILLSGWGLMTLLDRML